MMKLAALLLIWGVTIGVCIAFPTMHTVKKQEVDSDRCRDAVISIPKWFCTNISTQDRPDWLHKICDAIPQPTELQQTTGAVLPSIPNWICETEAVEGRLEKIKNVCKAIERFGDPRIGESLGIPVTLCSLGESEIKEKVLVDCGEGRAQRSQRGRRQTALGEIPDSICAEIRSPGYLGFLYYVCEEKLQHYYDIPDWICKISPDERVEILKSRCPSVIKNLLMASNQQTLNEAQFCRHISNPYFPTFLQGLCDSGTDPEVYDIPQIICTAAPENRVEILRVACGGAHLQQAVNGVPNAMVCEALDRSSFRSWLEFFCEHKPQVVASYGIPLSVCTAVATPETRIEMLRVLCGTVPEMRAKMEQSSLYICSDPTRVLNNCDEEPGIPDWFCGLPPEQHMEVLRSLCGGNLPAEKQQTGERVPFHICMMQVRDPSSFFELVTTNCEGLVGMPQSICRLHPQLRLKVVKEECGHTTKVVDQNYDHVMTKIPKWICSAISKLGLPAWLSNICEMNENSPDGVCDL